MLILTPPVETYSIQLRKKQLQLQRLLAPYQPPAMDVFTSPASHYRLRAEFKIWQQGSVCRYAVFPNQHNQPVFIDDFPVASKTITAAMPELLAHINEHDILRKKLFQLEFLSTLSGELLITLVYHKALTEDWLIAVNDLRHTLNPSWQIVGRSRKQKIVIDCDYVTERFRIDHHDYHYRQLEGCFSQPNGAICQQMLQWATDVSRQLGGDLLELYCGNGNFTVALAKNFRRVLATEISKNLVNTARYNFQLNHIDNSHCVRLAAEEISAAMAGERKFRRLAEIDLTGFKFSTVLVDPPRAGLDDKTVAMVQSFEHILYISCNPETLCNNLAHLCQTHRLVRLAFFDQFPYTHHAECGVLLTRQHPAPQP